MKVVTFGEIMMRLSPPHNERIIQAQNFNLHFGGAEANVAVSLAQFGIDSFFVTRIPNNEIGTAAINELRRLNVQTDFILRGGNRLGIYFLEIGASQRASKVIYDRTHSSIAEITPGIYDWNFIFNQTNWFHISGITPAVGDSVAEATIEALKIAREKSIQISCDLNFRKNLWSRKKAEKVMSEILAHVDVLIANEEDAESVFGIRAVNTNVHTGVIDAEKYQSVAEQLMKRFPQLKHVAITLRESISASVNNWSGVLWDGKNFYLSSKYNIHVVDRVGSGDAFCAGFIYSFLNQRKEKDALEFAVAASCLKHSIPGDFNLVSVTEVEALMNGDGSGRVKR